MAKTNKKHQTNRPGFFKTLKNQPWRQRFKNWRFYILAILILFGLWLASVVAIGYWYQIQHRNDRMEIGVSFAPDTAKYLGNDWQQNYLALLNDLGVRHFRLMSYWNAIEPSPGKFDFRELDWQFEQAQKYGADISLAVGVRQPRWPECHQPEWVKQLPDKEQESRLYEFLHQVVNRYKDNPALKDYQLENETANHMFGECKTPATKFDRDRLATELDIIKNLDETHSVNINTSNQSGTPIGYPAGEGVGFSIYKKAYMTNSGPFKFYWSFDYIPALWHSYRAGLVEILHGTPTFVHELQTEPWGPSGTRDLSVAEQNKSMNSKDIVKNVAFAKSTGMHRMYLWGSEWWYWRLTHFQDDSLWQTTKQIYQKSNDTGKFEPRDITIYPVPKQ